MHRREFIAGLGLAAASSVAARAQQAKGPVRIGFLFFGSPSNSYDQSLVEAFRQGLRQAGLVDGGDIELDVVWIAGDPDRAVSEAMQRGANLLVPSGTSASVAANRQAKETIPIVFISVGDPIAMGLVDNLSHPGRNVTGFSDILADLGGKLVDLARDLTEPRAKVIDYFWYSAWPDGLNRYQATETAARAVDVEFRATGVVEIAEVDNAFATIKKKGATSVIIQPSPFTYQHRGMLIESAMKHGLATIFAFPIAGRDGALVGYGPDYLHMYRKAPLYVDRILKGTKPADLPVEQPTKVQLIVNVKTAKALGFEVPLSLLIRADELVE